MAVSDYIPTLLDTDPKKSYSPEYIKAMREYLMKQSQEKPKVYPYTKWQGFQELSSKLPLLALNDLNQQERNSIRNYANARGQYQYGDSFGPNPGGPGGAAGSSPFRVAALGPDLPIPSSTPSDQESSGPTRPPLTPPGRAAPAAQSPNPNQGTSSTSSKGDTQEAKPQTYGPNGLFKPPAAAADAKYNVDDTSGFVDTYRDSLKNKDKNVQVAQAGTEPPPRPPGDIPPTPKAPTASTASPPTPPSGTRVAADEDRVGSKGGGSIPVPTGSYSNEVPPSQLQKETGDFIRRAGEAGRILNEQDIEGAIKNRLMTGRQYEVNKDTGQIQVSDPLKPPELLGRGSGALHFPQPMQNIPGTPYVTINKFDKDGNIIGREIVPYLPPSGTLDPSAARPAGARPAPATRPPAAVPPASVPPSPRRVTETPPAPPTLPPGPPPSTVAQPAPATVPAPPPAPAAAQRLPLSPAAAQGPTPPAVSGAAVSGAFGNLPQGPQGVPAWLQQQRQIPNAVVQKPAIPFGQPPPPATAGPTPQGVPGQSSGTRGGGIMTDMPPIGPTGQTPVQVAQLSPEEYKNLANKVSENLLTVAQGGDLGEPTDEEKTLLANKSTSPPSSVWQPFFEAEGAKELPNPAKDVQPPSIFNPDLSRLGVWAEDKQAYAKRSERAAEKQIDTYSKWADGIHSSGDQARKQMPTFKYWGQLLENPKAVGLSQGPLAVPETYFKAIRQNVGRIAEEFQDKGYRVPKGMVEWAHMDGGEANQIFAKHQSALVLENLRNMLGPNSGQFRVYELQLLNKAMGGQEISPGAQRVVTAVLDRINDRTMLYDEMATQWENEHGSLDPRFRQAAINFEKKHPAFTREEFNKLMSQDWNEPVGARPPPGSVVPATAPPAAAPPGRAAPPPGQWIERPGGIRIQRE